jgi:uncharacterized protein YggU (UPF0235/DUF167 family)
MSSQKVIRLLNQIVQTPDNGKLRAELVQALLEEGMSDEAKSQIRLAQTTLTKTLKLPEVYYRPVLEILASHGEEDAMEMVLTDLETSYDTEDEFIRRTLRKFRRDLYAQYPVLPPGDIKEHCWEAPKLLEPSGLEEWLAGKVLDVTDDEVEVVLGTLTSSKTLEVEKAFFDKDAFRRMVRKLPARILDTPWFEFGTYEEGSVVVIQFKKDKA